MTAAFAAPDAVDFPPFDPGTVWLVGAGPGAPGLLSLLACHALAEADVILHDALIGPAILRFACRNAELVPVGKRAGQPSPTQDEISGRLIALARAGKRVLRLKGGDPFVFGRGAEEAAALHGAGIPFRIVPGISAGIGGLAYAGIPLTHRDANQAVLFLTGHDGTGTLPETIDWPAVARAAPVVVMFMALRHLPVIARRLLDAGRHADESLAVVSNAALPNQTVAESTLGRAETLRGLPTPAIVVLGPVLGYRDVLDWYGSALRGYRLG